MANRYWVGGSGTWDATNTTNWSATSGGAGGASAPTSADNVYFDSKSNAAAATVNISSNPVCLSWEVSTPAASLAFAFSSNSVLGVYGNLNHTFTNNVGVNAVAGSVINLWGAGAIAVPSGASYGSVTIRIRSSGTYTLAGPITSTLATLNVVQGGFDSANFSMSIGVFQAGTTGSSASSVTFGTSEITVANLFEMQSSVVVTTSIASSTIKLTSPTAKLVNQGYAFGKVYFSSKTSGTITISGAATGSYDVLSIDSPSTSGHTIFALCQTAFTAETLTLGDTNTPDKNIVLSGDLAKRVLTVQNFSATSNVTFIDIQAAGVSAPWSGSRFGNGGGNVNINFEAGVTRYWYSTGQASAAWKTASWCNSPTDTVGSLDNLPLAQDTAVFRDVGLVSGGKITAASTDQIDVATIDCSARALPMDLNRQGEVRLYKDLILSPSSTWGTSPSILKTYGKGAMSLTTQGNKLSSVQTYTSNPAVLTLIDDCFCTGGFSTAAGGRVDLNNKVLTCNTFKSSNAITRSFDFKESSIVRITGSNTVVYDTSTSNTLTFTGVNRFEFTYAGSTGTRQVITAGATSGVPVPNIYVMAGTDSFQCYYTFGTIDTTGFTGTFNNSTRNIMGDLVYGVGTKFPALNAALTQTLMGTSAQRLTLNGQAMGQSLIVLGTSLTLTDTNPTFDQPVSFRKGDLILQAGGTATFASLGVSMTTAKALKSTNPANPAYINIRTGPTSFVYTSIQSIKADSATSDIRAYTNYPGDGTSYRNTNLGGNEGIKFIPSGMTMMSFM